MNVRNYTLLGRSQGQQMGHNLPVPVMPTRQQSRPPALGQPYPIGRMLYATGHAPCTNAQAIAVAATMPPSAYTLPPVPPILHHLSSSTHNGMSGEWGPMMQGQDMQDVFPRDRRNHYTPTWHLQGTPSVGNALATYVEGIPSSSARGRETGHMAPPPYQLAPPQPLRSSETQQLLVLTPWDQSMRGVTSEAEANSMTTATEGKSQASMPPPRPPPYQCMPPPQQPPASCGLYSSNDSGDSQMRSAVGLVSITEKMANMQSTYDRNAGPIDVDIIPTPISKPQLFKLRTQISRF